MKILSLKTISEAEIIFQSVKVLQSGGLLIYPTETVYGLGVDATNPSAVRKLVSFKSRPLGKPFSVAVADQRMAGKYVELNTTAKKLYHAFLPGPLTVISKLKTFNHSYHSHHSSHSLSPGVASELGTLGIRIPDYPLIIEIVKRLNRPITATSANQSYKKRPYQISDVMHDISDRKKKLIDLILDAGELPRREPSTVIDTTLEDPTVLRQGDIAFGGKNTVLTRNEQGTQNVAKELWQKYEQHTGLRPVVFALEGPMGAGKTQFVKGVARAMGIKKEMTSPTYSLMNQYSLFPAPFSFLHIDAWRMESDSELEDLGFAKTISDKSVIAVEWADRVADAIRRYQEDAIIIWVKIKYGKFENERFISWGVI